MENEFDFIIVGQGLAGSVLSILLERERKKILLIDRFDENTSSLVAAGLVNPITGRRVVRSWMSDKLIPFAEKFYSDAEKDFGKAFYRKLDVLEVIDSVKDLNEWQSRMSENDVEQYFNKDSPENIYKNKIKNFLKMIRITSSGWLDVKSFTESCREKLKSNSSLLNEKFDFDEIKFQKDFIGYKNLSSRNIIFCEGYQAATNPLWNWLPFLPAKGELLTIECHDLPENFILMSGIFLIPIGKNRFCSGSTYEWNFQDERPTEAARIKINKLLHDLLKVDFKIIDHKSGIRPTVKDRRPFLGRHPAHSNAWIFNGLGTKGVQLAPYFANQLVNSLLHEKKLPPEVDISRFVKN